MGAEFLNACNPIKGTSIGTFLGQCPTPFMTAITAPLDTSCSTKFTVSDLLGNASSARTNLPIVGNFRLAQGLNSIFRNFAAKCLAS